VVTECFDCELNVDDSNGTWIPEGEFICTVCVEKSKRTYATGAVDPRNRTFAIGDAVRVGARTGIVTMVDMCSRLPLRVLHPDGFESSYLLESCGFVPGRAIEYEYHMRVIELEAALREALDVYDGAVQYKDDWDAETLERLRAVLAR